MKKSPLYYKSGGRAGSGSPITQTWFGKGWETAKNTSGSDSYVSDWAKRIWNAGVKGYKAGKKQIEKTKTIHWNRNIDQTPEVLKKLPNKA